MSASAISLESLPQLALSLRRWLSRVLLLLAVLLSTLAWSYWPQTPLRYVGVEGALSKVRPDEVVAQLRSLHQEGFMQLDLVQARAAVEQLPWVARARVERQWPARLQVTVWERSAYARWGENALVDTEGKRYAPPVAQFPTGLPLLQGPAGREREVMQAYSTLSSALADTPFAVAALSMDERGEWTATTRGGIPLRLGRDAPESRIPLIRGQITQALGSRLSEINYVDLRYTNGFAVGWKPQLETPAAGVKHG